MKRFLICLVVLGFCSPSLGMAKEKARKVASVMVDLEDLKKDLGADRFIQIFDSNQSSGRSAYVRHATSSYKDMQIAGISGFAVVEQLCQQKTVQATDNGIYCFTK